MSQIIVKCIRNDSRSLPYQVGGEFMAEYMGGAYKIFDGKGSHIISHLDGHYVEFIIAT